MKTYTIHPTEDQEKLLLPFLEEQNIEFLEEEDEPLPPHVIAGIKEGMADVESGRFITKEEFYKRTGLDKYAKDLYAKFIKP